SHNQINSTTDSHRLTRILQEGTEETERQNDKSKKVRAGKIMLGKIMGLKQVGPFRQEILLKMRDSYE
ncbi:MAG: hypothetical protein DME25_20980, partial [Verrucomicrobia bacterium]